MLSSWGSAASPEPIEAEEEEKAIELYEEGRSGGDAVAATNLGTIYEKQGKVLQAMELYEELSQDAGAHCCNGVLWLATRRAAMSGAPRPWMGFLHLPRQPEQRPQQAALVQAAVAWLGAQLAFSPGAGRG